jgi:hypothetical protein
MLKRYVPICALLLIVFGLTLHFSRLIPPFEGPDETVHFGYVTEMRSTGGLPARAGSLAERESGSAPLGYVLYTLWSRLGPDYFWDGHDLPTNPWIWTDAPSSVADNRSIYRLGPNHIPDERFSDAERALTWMRLLSPLMGVLAVAFTYVAARRLFRQAGWARAAALFYGCNPALLHTFALLGNDVPAALGGASSTAALLGLACARRSRTVLLCGLIIGTATLTKASLLVFMPAACLVVLFRQGSRGSRVRHLALMLAPLAVTALPWYGWNALRYGDPFGIGPHLAMPWAFNPPRTLADVLVDDRGSALLTVFGTFGGMARITLPEWMYLLPVALSLVGLLGLARARRWSLEVRALLFMVVTICAALLRWMMSLGSVSGRLLLPGYAAFVLLVAFGLAAGWPRLGRAWARAGGASLLLMAFSVGWLTLPAAYGVNLLPPDSVPALDGPKLRFGEVEFLGYRIVPRAIRPNQRLSVMLCWRSLRTDAPLAVPYPFFFMVTDGHQTVARRDSYTGMGSYTYWGPNAAFCDRFSVTTNDAVRPGVAYRVSVGLFDRADSRPLPENDGKPLLVGYIQGAQPPLTPTELAGVVFRFGEIYLLNAAIADRGDFLSLETHWGTGTWQPRLVTLVARVVDSAGKPFVQMVLPFGEGTYPPTAWESNARTAEQIDRIFLPLLPPGQYRLTLSLYEQTDPAVDLMALAEQTPIPARTRDGERPFATVGSFTR